MDALGNGLTEVEFALIAGSYLFTVGAYLFGWKILSLLWNLRSLVTNHQAGELQQIKADAVRHHDADLQEFAAIKARISVLEDKK